MSKATITELEVLFTADTKAVDKAAARVEGKAKEIEGKPATQTIDGDASDALEAMDRVEAEAKKIVSAKTMATVDANIERAETSLEKVRERLDYLHSVETEMEVTGDIKRAEAALQQIERRRDALVKARSEMEVMADTSRAEASLEGLTGIAEEAGAEAGEGAGDEFGDSVIAALASIPIAGAIVGVGAAAAKALVGAFMDGLQKEKGRDRLQALTGISEVETRRIANAAAEAYADGFGESIESNMTAAKLGLQFDIIDEKSVTRDSTKVISSLAGIADVLDEDVRPTAQAVSVMLSSGIAKSADDAFDILAAGAREGVNRSEDLLDTFTEYPALFKRLGLSGEESLGLINQAMKAGARNSDVAADALKEFQIRATDGSTASAEGFKLLGLSAAQMTAQISKGGESAKTGLDLVLDRLRGIEDPVKRNAAAVALFGTKAEDLGDSLFAMDLSNAVAQLNGVKGAAKTMFDTMASNDASKVEGAFRNMEVAADGLKGALVTAFSEPLGNFATWVSQNRGPLLKFFQDLINGAIDFAQTANTGIGDFVSGPLATAVEGLAKLIEWMPGDQDVSDLEELATSMRGFSNTTGAANTKLEQMREKFNGFADDQVNLGYVHDAQLKLAAAIEKVGYKADGTKMSMQGMNVATLGSTQQGRQLETQIRRAIEALNGEIGAAVKAGESQSALSARYREGTAALMTQLRQMGFTEQQAYELINAYGGIPTTKGTTITSNANAQRINVNNLGYSIRHLPDGSVQITANTRPAKNEIETFISKNTGRRIILSVYGQRVGQGPGGTGGITQHDGGIVEYMGAGGLRGLTRMQPIAQMVPANTWRVVGDRGDVPEAYIPLDGSARSMAILLETMRRMGVWPMADGGVLSSNAARAVRDPRPVSFSISGYGMDELADLIVRRLNRQVGGLV